MNHAGSPPSRKEFFSTLLTRSLPGGWAKNRHLSQYLMLSGLMHFKSPLPSDITEIFHKFLLEWSRHNELSIVVAALPLQSTDEIQIRATDEPLIKAKRGRKLMPALTSWPAVGMHAKRNPSLACVLEGMADLSFGVTDVMAKNARVESA